MDDDVVDVCGQMHHFASEVNVCLSLHRAVGLKQKNLFAWVMMLVYVVEMGMVTCVVEIWRFEIADESADGAATVCTCAGAARSKSNIKVLSSPPHVWRASY